MLYFLQNIINFIKFFIRKKKPKKIVKYKQHQKKILFVFCFIFFFHSILRINKIPVGNVKQFCWISLIQDESLSKINANEIAIILSSSVALSSGFFIFCVALNKRKTNFWVKKKILYND